jgi:quinol monooxygenase YgiN
MPMDSSCVRLSIEWVVPLGETGPITTAVHTLMMLSRAEHGCLTCGVSTRLGTHTTIRYTEDWRSEEDLRAHVLSDRFTRLAGLLENATEPPRIAFQLPGGTRGLDYAIEVRERHGM